MKVEATIKLRKIAYQRVSIELPDDTPKGKIWEELAEEAALAGDWKESSCELTLLTGGGVTEEDQVVINGEVSTLFDGEAL